MILTGPSRSFFKKRVFQKNPILRILAQIFFLLLLPSILGCCGYILAFNLDVLYFGATNPAPGLGNLLYIPFTFIPFFCGLFFYMWLNKD
ncbi:TPA: hypothetical protein MW242_002923 [Acinetobacter baumannii]|nr:hypothetical protein [Acinetobacter baumannii]